MGLLIRVVFALIGAAVAWQAGSLPWRLGGVLVVLLVAAWCVARIAEWRRRTAYLRPMRARMYYIGVHPRLRTQRWVTVIAAPEGLVVNMGRVLGSVTLKYGRLLNSSVVRSPDRRWRTLQLSYGDLAARREYPMQFAARNYAPDKVLEAIERRLHEAADLAWATWRGLSLALPVTAEERRAGGERDVFYTRKVACASCGGIESWNLACRDCKGKGAITENAYAKVRIRKRALLGHRITVPNAGHEDLNGNRGPLMLTLVEPGTEGTFQPSPVPLTAREKRAKARLEAEGAAEQRAEEWASRPYRRTVDINERTAQDPQ